MSASNKKRKNALGSRTDPRWEQCIEVDKMAKKVKCKYCGGVRSGGIFRHKHHLACIGIDVEGCLQIPNDVKSKFRALLEATSEASSAKRKKLNNISEEKCESGGNQRVRGGLDAFVNKSKHGLQTTLDQKFKKEEREQVCQQIACCFLH